MNLDLITPGVLMVGIDASPPPPLHMGEPDSPDFSGFEVDLMAAIAGDLGLAVRHRSVLWRDMLRELEGARLDLVCTATTISPERATRVAFSAPYLDIQLALVTRRDARLRSIDEVKGRHVGVRVATTAAEYVWKHAHARRITFYDMNEDAYAAVAAGEVDAAVDDSPIAAWFVCHRSDLAPVTLLPGTDAQYALMIAQDKVALQRALDDALSRIRGDGRYAAIHRRWFGARSE